MTSADNDKPLESTGNAVNPTHDPEATVQSGFMRKAFAVFDEWLQADIAAREQILAAAGLANPSLRAAVESLINADQQAEQDSFLRASALDALDTIKADDAPDDSREGSLIGQTIGPWRVERLLGIGGMGQVWLATRNDGRYEAKAAIKLISGSLIESAHRRFETEGRLLARLEHPHIARLLDAGERPDGTRYLVLEFVDGERIDHWCDNRKATVDERLKLFLQICSAVSYAHANLVVHRDLKPSNIMVQNDGQVKLLDFGIAKLIEVDSRSELTIEAGVALTPEYAAPEQIDSRPISVATDVYSLGVVLYRLLAGVRPYGVDKSTPAQLARAVLDQEPARLSRASFDTLSEQRATIHPTDITDAQNRGEPTGVVTTETIAAARSTTPQRLRNLLSGDLDIVLAKALKKQPQERYVSVQAFADDITHFLAHEPIASRPDTWTYRANRFVRRNWLPVSAAVALAAVTVAGVVGVLIQANKTRIEAERATAIKDFLIGVFSASDPRVASDGPRNQITAKDLLDVSAAKIDTDFAEYPETRLELLSQFEGIYTVLGDEQRAKDLQTRRLAVAKAMMGADNPTSIGVLIDDAYREYLKADLAAARKLLGEADVALLRSGTDKSLQRGRWALMLSMVLAKDATQTEERLRLLSIARDRYAQFDPTSSERIAVLGEMATLHRNARRYQDAINSNREALAANAAVPLKQRDDRQVATLLGNLAQAQIGAGLVADALESYEKSTALWRKTSGDSAPQYWMQQAYFAGLVHSLGDRKRANAMFDELVKLLPPESTPNMQALSGREARLFALVTQGSAEPVLPRLEAIHAALEKSATQAAVIPNSEWMLGTAYLAANRPVDASTWAKRALAASNSPKARLLLARALLAVGEIEPAKTELNKLISNDKSPLDTLSIVARADLARLKLSSNDTAGALSDSAEALALWPKRTGEYDVRMLPYMQRIRADVLAASGEIEAAQKLEDAAWEASQKYDAPESPTVKRRTMRRV